MNCPFCGSDQTNFYHVRHDWIVLECVNCDREVQGPYIPADHIEFDLMEGMVKA